MPDFPGSCILFVTCALLLCTPAAAEQAAIKLPASARALQGSSLLDGTFIRRSYLNALKLSHSPYASITKGEGVVVIDVSSLGHKKSFDFDWNFHEGDAKRFLSANSDSINYEGGQVDQAIHIRIESGHAFLLTAAPGISGWFDRIDSLTRQVNRLTVAGRYTDAKGAPYVFEENGNASFPGRQTRYEVGLDHVGAAFDWIRLGNEDFGYRRTRSGLTLYHLTGIPEKPFSRRPFLVLSRQTD